MGIQSISIEPVPGRMLMPTCEDHLYCMRLAVALKDLAHPDTALPKEVD